MTLHLLSEIPYRRNAATWFEVLADRPWSVFLDSGRPRTAAGRYDILTADPYLTLATWGDMTEIRRGDRVRLSPEDPFVLLRSHLGKPVENLTGLPFSGGAIGWFGYDLARRIERLPERSADAEHIPDMVIGFYDWALVADHEKSRAWLVGAGRDPATRERWDELSNLFCSPPAAVVRAPLWVPHPPCSNMTREAYGCGFRRIKSYIREGDCYQVNLAQRFSASAEGDAWASYRELRYRSPAPFSAFLSTPFAKVLSSSPERFLELRVGWVETRPIKGTRPRGTGPEEDSAQAQDLGKSVKDRAENLMIVDLLRNDLGRVCRPGSIRVPRLFDVESFATVHHLVSTVTGYLAPGEDAVSLLRACFPGGSITGAPKIRAMEIIEELEPHRRGVYCGAIGYLGFDGAMDTNIAIRTLVHSAETLRFWAGGGIVYDSDEEAEYQETYDKAAALFWLLDRDRCAGVGR